MNQSDCAGAVNYALRRLQQELPPALVYHSVQHTRDDVLPGVERLAALEGVSDEPLMLMRTAAAFHDIGFVEQVVEHERIGVRIATEILPDFGFSDAQIEQIAGMIWGNQDPQNPQTLLEQIMADADLDVLGRDDFFSRSTDLRAELVARGQPMTDLEWFSGQVMFMEAHRYFTDSARRLRLATKLRNIEAMKLAAAQAS